MAGRFISFEGIDGAGKSTQVRALAATLRARGREVVETREPGGAPGAELIRALLVEGDPGRWSPETECLLFTAARRDHLERTIRPALDRGATVVTDRFADLDPRLPGRRPRRPPRHRRRPARARHRPRPRPHRHPRPRPRARRSAAASPAAAPRTASSASASTSSAASAPASWRWPPSSPAAAASSRPRATPPRSRPASPRSSHDRRPRGTRPPPRRAAPARDRGALRPGRRRGRLPRRRRHRPAAPRLARHRPARHRQGHPRLAHRRHLVAGGTAPTLDMPRDHPAFRQLAALGSPQLFLLRRPWNEKTERLHTAITVDEVRALQSFYHLTAADGGRRVAIVDAADELTPSAANALLKVLEEPPSGAVLLLVSHRPAALLPTIRSRCRELRLAPLGARRPRPRPRRRRCAARLRRRAGAGRAGRRLGRRRLPPRHRRRRRPLRRDRRPARERPPGRPPPDPGAGRRRRRPRLARATS